jgi:hypothetical protein
MDELNQNCNPKTMNRKTKATNKAQIRRVRVNLIKLPFVICRVFLASGLVAAAMAPFFPTHAQEATASPSTGARDFDFLVGEWRVHHRRLKPGSNEWVEFDGTCASRKILGGLGNITGATIGGFILAFVEEIGAGYISSGYRDAMGFLIIIVVLLFKPTGLFARAERVG